MKKIKIQSKTNPDLFIAKIENRESEFFDQLTDEEKIFIDWDNYIATFTKVTQNKYKLSFEEVKDYVNNVIKRMYKV